MSSKVIKELRDLADWLESPDGQAMISDKGLEEFGVRRYSIVELLHTQSETDGIASRLLNSAISSFYWETDPDKRDAIKEVYDAAFSQLDQNS